MLFNSLSVKIQSLVDSALAGDRLSLARVLSQVENDTPLGREALDQLYPFAGKAHRIGVTGSPGTGKSSLVNKIALAFRSDRAGRPKKVAIVAVDPSSPFTGGAVLGDRVRMRELSGDPGVFIRSMASRGALGGLARATAGVVQVFDAVGFDVILIETVGAGQAEIDIARLADTTVVVEAPGLGDDIQSIKAGILEIADILVVNKADRPGAEHTQRILKTMLDLSKPPEYPVTHSSCTTLEDQAPIDITASGWMPPVLLTDASSGEGIDELVEAFERHAEYLRGTGEWQKRETSRLQAELDDLIQAALVARWRSGLPDSAFQSVFADLSARRISPARAVELLTEECK
jgi:LAO/AO transport system kinase